MEKKALQNRRRNYFIKKEFQTKFILKFCLLLILGCCLMGILIYFLSTKTVTASFENLRLIAKNTADFILPALALSSLIAIIIVSLACIVVVLFISHRIAGPLYRLERSIEEVTHGDLTVHVRFRKRDEIKVLADTLNEMVKKLREAITPSQKNITDLNNMLAGIKEKLNQAGMPQNEIDKVLKPCEDRLKRLEQSLSYFKV